MHVPTRVMLWTGTTPLPEWGYKQQEVNGNKAPQERSATWYVEEIIEDESEFRRVSSPFSLVLSPL